MKKTIYISEETFNELTKPKKKKTSHLNPDKWYEDKADFSISSSEGDLGYAHVAGGDAGMVCEEVNDTDLHKYIESYLDFLERNNYKINPRPAIEFNNEQQDGMNIRTGYYDPDERKVVVFINGRHVKDILRSFAHEMVHHMQNLRDEHMDWGHGGDLVDDDKLRELEGEAYHVGNILFREWTEELKKTRKLDESKIFNLILENEGTNMKKARRYMESLGYPVEKRQRILDAIRTDVPNSRLQQCKFLLGVTRMYINGELNGHKEIADLNKVLKYVASNAHVNEYDNNLNGESLDTLVNRFSSVATDDLQKSMDVSNNRRLTANASYTIVPIDCPEDAYDYSDYTTWCVTYDENMYNSYTQGGTGRFYFCLRDGFEDEPEVVGDGCPLDSYGLSMIAVSVTQSGELNTVTCRWNHDNGGNDSIMTLEELENVLGRNFYKTFVPYTEEELIAKGVITVGYAEKLLENGTTFDELFEDYHDLGNGYSCVYTCNLTDDDDYGDYVFNYNIINNKTKKFVFREWLDFVDDTFIDGALLIGKGRKCNYLDKNFKPISSEWFQDASPFGTNGAPQGFGEVRLNGKYNFINANGEYLWNIWFDDIMFIEYCLCGVVNDKSATYVLKDAHGKFVFNPNNPEASLITNVLRESVKIRRKPENTEKLDGLNEAKESDVDLSSFKVQDKLNPKIWVNDLMDSRVRLKLLDIAQDFVEFLDVTWVKPEDTIVVGSIANYNWSRYSDIDLHVVIDYSKVDDRKKFVENYFQSKKKEWNDTHDKISIFGFPVELYVQDKDADNASSAVYSIDKNKWLKKPTRNTFTKKDIDSESIKKRASKIMTDIENIEDDDKDSNDEYRNRKLYDRSSSLIDDITNKRKKSLSATKDEMNTDNLVFKVLRRNGYLDKLFNLRDKTYDKMNSLD